MSRSAPRIEQYVDGKKVEGYCVIPIQRDGVTYALVEEKKTNEDGSPTGQSWTLEAKNDATGDVLWGTVLCERVFEPMLETDVQETYPVDLAFLNEGVLVVKFERYTDTSGVYVVSQETGEVLS
jgi:hypothetical protein